jgi:hypothetical protein
MHDYPDVFKAIIPKGTWDYNWSFPAERTSMRCS